MGEGLGLLDLVVKRNQVLESVSYFRKNGFDSSF